MCKMIVVSESLAFLDLFRKYGNKVKQVLDNSHIGHLENRRFRVFVDGHNKGFALEPT